MNNIIETRYPTNFEVNGIPYRAEAGHALANGEGNVYIDIYRSDIEYRADAHAGSFSKVVEWEYTGNDPYIASQEASETFRKSGYSKDSDEQWLAVIAQFKAMINELADYDTSVHVLPTAPAGTPALSLEEMALAARIEWLNAGAPTGSHLSYLGDDYDEL